MSIHVIASAAMQSTCAAQRRTDCFAALAMTKDSVCDDDGSRRVGRGAKRRAHHLSSISLRDGGHAALCPPYGFVALTTPVHSKTRTSLPDACSRPGSAFA